MKYSAGDTDYFCGAKNSWCPPFLFMGEFFQGGEGIRFEEGEGVKLKKMAQGEKGNDWNKADYSYFDGQRDEAIKCGGWGVLKIGKRKITDQADRNWA